MQQTIAAVILAGGQGRRLGGVDKALLPLAGKPLLAHVLARLAPQASPVLLSANGDTARFRPFGVPVVPDTAPDRGPLAGIAAAANACRARWPLVTHLLTIPVDTPLLPLELVPRLADAAASLPHLVAVAESGGRTHWTIALWPIDAAIALEHRIEHDGVRRLQNGVETVGWQTVPFADASGFLNINRIEDLQTVTRLLGEN